jgi:hypothetical protein
MNTPSCSSPLDWPTLLGYWLGEQDAAAVARIEEHYLGCSQCSRRLEALASLAQGVRTVANTGAFDAVLTEHFVQIQKERGQHVRAYRLSHNGSVNCTIAPEDDLVVSYLEAPLADVTRLDLILVGPDGAFEIRREDIPFVPESGNVLIATSTAILRTLPKATARVRLLAVDGHGERIIGDYRFDHTPYEQLERQ